MGKVLLVFPYKIADTKNFEKIIDQFENNGFTIHIFDNFGKEDFQLDILPSIIDYVKNDTTTEIERIDVLSNIKQLIFSWFRCYNSLIDNYIYYIDSKDSFFKVSETNYKFFEHLWEFSSIENERLEGKIYLNLDFNNFLNMFAFMMQKNRYRYFDILNNIEFNNKIPKRNILKTYNYDGRIYKFDMSEKAGEIQFGEIFLEPLNAKNEIDIKIDKDFLSILGENLYFIIYVVVGLYKMNNQQLNNALLWLFNQFHYFEEDKKTLIHDQVIDYLDNYSAPFPEKIAFYSLLVSLGTGKKVLLQQIMELLLNDSMYMDYHYSVLFNTFFYINRCGLELYDECYADRRKELERITRHLKDDFKIKKPTIYKEKTIAIIVDQLLSLKHSPTKVILDYVINLKKFHPEYQITIFVEDNLVLNYSENFLLYGYSSQVSGLCKKEHESYLTGYDIEIYYSDCNLSKKERTHRIIRAINDLSPYAILTNSDISIAREILYPYYPIVYMFFGGVYCTGQADVYLHRNKAEVAVENEKYKLLDMNKVYTIRYGVELPKPKSIFVRDKYGIKKDDFVMITVGNRLDAEMNEEYIDLMANFIKDHPNVKWLVLGNTKLEYLVTNYDTLINNFVIKVNYEADLPGLYRICDVYANPFREGGGYSIAMAMDAGLPIIALNRPSAALYYIDEDNCAGETSENYLRELVKLYNDIDYRRDKSNYMRQRITEFDFKEAIDKLVEYLEIAKEKFKERHK